MEPVVKIKMFHVEHWAVLHCVTKICEKKGAKLHVEHCARRSASPTFQMITPILCQIMDVMIARLPLFISLVLLCVPR